MKARLQQGRRLDPAAHAAAPEMSGGGAGGCVEAAHGGVWAVLWSALFLFITWLAGQCTGRLGLPPLAGEIIAGMVRAGAHVGALRRALPRRSLRRPAFAARRSS